MEMLEYDEAAIGNPFPLVETMLAEPEDGETCLALSDCFEEDDFPDVYEEMLARFQGDFDTVEARLTKKLGPPTYQGRHRDDGYPRWAMLGYRVVYWEHDGRMIYVHLTHNEPEMPLQLNVGVVTGPPDDWFAGE